MFAAGNSVAASSANYIEDVFSTYLYTGNGSTQTITNGINLSTKGGLVWLKGRSAATAHALYDTIRGATFDLASNTTAAQTTQATGLTSFGTTGFSVGALAKINTSTATYASWTFREQAKFFDIVTWTGNSVAGRTIAHNLGSVPGCIIVKNTSNVQGWPVYHRSMHPTVPQNYYEYLNSVDVRALDNAAWNNTAPTSSVFTVGGNDFVNGSGQTYVAYLFAHDAGGFGLTGNDNVISCGGYTGNGATIGSLVSLGYEPQWLLIKNTTGSTDWRIVDNMRGIPISDLDNVLAPNTSNPETDSITCNLDATGFYPTGPNYNSTGGTYIYIAIRRGPMKVPTLATTVFGISARTGTGANATVTGGSGVSDVVLVKNRGAAVADLLSSRLTNTEYLVTSTTAAGVAAGATILQASPWDVMDGVKVGTTSTITNASANTFVNYLFSRAPGFMDVVAYTGTGSVLNVTHNLNVAPELMIVKNRSAIADWRVYNAAGGSLKSLYLNATPAYDSDSTVWNNTSPTSSVFTVGTNSNVNVSGNNYVSYLFATVAGVSKVGSYTGTAALQTVACGFAAGARFVMIKRTDAVGDWYYWDSVRGLSSGNDPYLLMNTAAAEVTATNYVDTDTTGFKVTAAAPAGLNASGGTYIFLAIA